MTRGSTKRSGRPVRPRNAAATRAAILNSARQAFARAGYDGVGVREIAEGAGVTAMLVNRYFGSKERLFAEVVADIMTRPIILTGDRLKSDARRTRDGRSARQADGRPAARRSTASRSCADPHPAEPPQGSGGNRSRRSITRH